MNTRTKTSPMATDGNDISQIYYPSHMPPKITVYQ